MISTVADDRSTIEWPLAALKALDAAPGWGWLRISRPAPAAAFSRRDTLARGYPRAAQAARAHGFEPVVRGVGGRLVAYHGGSLVLDIVARHPEPRRQIMERFRQVAYAVAGGLAGLGLDARVGPVPGEYCAGEFSVNVGGRVKVAGTAQRLTGRSVLFGVVVLVEDPEPVRAVLSDAYPLLGLDWDPGSLGCVADHLPGVSSAEVGDALLRELAPVLSISRGTRPVFPLDGCWEVP